MYVTPHEIRMSWVMRSPYHERRDTLLITGETGMSLKQSYSTF